MSAGTPQLDGFSVLDLSSVGPASRASRMLADYGAAVVKVGPTAKQGAVQVRPPFHTYGGGRGMKRIQVDLKAPAGVAANTRNAASPNKPDDSARWP